MMDKLSIYTFGKEGMVFYINFVPDRNLKKQVLQLFDGYDMFPEMKDFGVDEAKESNKDILMTIYSLGVFKIVINDGFKDVVILNELPKENFINIDLVKYFLEYRKLCPRVGIFTFVDNHEKSTIIFNEWLPRIVNFKAVEQIPDWQERYDIYSCNVVVYKKVAWFVLYQKIVIDQISTWVVTSYVEIDDVNVFAKTSQDYLNRTKMLQIQSMNEHIEGIFNHWKKVYNARRELCKIEMVYDINFYDFIIYLYQLHELIDKVKDIKHPMLWTTVHNEFNKEFREFNTLEYTHENRVTIIKLFENETEKPYSFINDFFREDLI